MNKRTPLFNDIRRYLVIATRKVGNVVSDKPRMRFVDSEPKKHSGVEAALDEMFPNPQDKFLWAAYEMQPGDSVDVAIKDFQEFCKAREVTASACL